MIKKGDLYFPSEEFKKGAWLKDKKIYQEAAKDPVKFWEKLAKGLFWLKKWRKAFEHKPPYFKWFLGGKINITSNIFEKNPLGWEKIKDKAALIWEPEPVNEKPKTLTYRGLSSVTCKFANALLKLGVKKGDRVGIYLPMIPEVIISMLACARIGAVHTVVFSAFSPAALKIRLQITDAKILITADGYYRRGQIINLKENADEGIKETNVEKTVVVKRTGNEIPWDSQKDLWWYELVKNESDECEAEVMDSEDPLFILYTSGCCHKDTLIQLENGEIKKISDLVEKGGSNLINLNLERLEKEIDLITNKYKYFWPFQLWKIQTPLSILKVTPNHPFFVLRGDGDVIEKEAKDLKIGEHILQMTKIKIKGKKQQLPMPKIEYHPEKCNYQHLANKPNFPKFLTPVFCQFLGYLAGDGHGTDQSIQATDKDKDNLLFYKWVIEKELGIRGYIKRDKRQRLEIYSAFLARYLKIVFPEIFSDSYEKKVPILIQKAENKCLSGFIRGIFDAEGSVAKGGVKITCQSKELIQTLQMLLLRFGIIGNYFEENRITHFGEKYYKILVPGLRITDRESLKIFKERIDFSSIAKIEKLNKLLLKLKNKKLASMIHQFPINELCRLLRKTIELPKKESHRIFLDSYMYSKRKIKKDRIPEIRKYIQRKINLVRSLNLSGRKRTDSNVRNEIKMAASLFKVSQEKITEISEKTPGTVHQYFYAKKLQISEKSLNKFYKKLLPYLSDLKKEKLEILRQILEKIKRLEKLKDVGFFEIKNIEKIKNDSNFVYDLTALKNHNYVANSFVVHNSTGIPKGCLHTCGGYTVQANFTGKWIFDLHQDSILWCTSDPGWITGTTYTIYSPLLNGVTTLMFEGAPDWPTPDRWAKIIEKHKVTIFYTAPTAIRMFEKYGAELLKNYKFESLRLLGSVGEPIDESAWLWYFNEVGKERCPIVDTWWQTESGGILITSLPGIGPFRPAFTGLPFPGTKFDILAPYRTEGSGAGFDDKPRSRTSSLRGRGKSCPVGKEGNLVMLPPFAPGLLRGIYKDPKKYLETYWSQYPSTRSARSGQAPSTSSGQAGEIYFTSDAAYKDKNGLIRIVGRVDDVIKVAGHRITTGELEAAINLHPDITECAVIGIPDEIKGEVPAAFVVLKKLAETRPPQILKEEIINQVRNEIGPIALPKEVYLVEDLPKTRSGKVMRRILKRLFTGEELGDLSTLANPEIVERIKKIVKL